MSRKGFSTSLVIIVAALILVLGVMAVYKYRSFAPSLSSSQKLSTPTATVDTSDWNTYIEDRYTIIYPKDFTPENDNTITPDYNNGNAVKFINKKNGDIITISEAENAKLLKLNEALGNGPSLQYASDLISGKTNQNITIDKVQGVCVENISAGISGTAIDVIWIYGNKIYQATANSENGSKILKNMLIGFKFIDEYYSSGLTTWSLYNNETYKIKLFYPPRVRYSETADEKNYNNGVTGIYTVSFQSPEANAKAKQPSNQKLLEQFQNRYFYSRLYIYSASADMTLNDTLKEIYSKVSVDGENTHFYYIQPKLQLYSQDMKDVYVYQGSGGGESPFKAVYIKRNDRIYIFTLHGGLGTGAKYSTQAEKNFDLMVSGFIFSSIDQTKNLAAKQLNIPADQVMIGVPTIVTDGWIAFNGRKKTVPSGTSFIFSSANGKHTLTFVGQMCPTKELISKEKIPQEVLDKSCKINLEWKDYSNSQYGFSFHYPSNYLLTQMSSYNNSLFTVVLENPNPRPGGGYPQPNVQVIVFKNDAKDLSDWISKHATTLPFDDPSISMKDSPYFYRGITDKRDTRLGGISAVTFKSNAFETQPNPTLALVNDYIIGVMFDNENENKDPDLKTLYPQILSSFKFTSTN